MFLRRQNLSEIASVDLGEVGSIGSSSLQCGHDDRGDGPVASANPNANLNANANVISIAGAGGGGAAVSQANIKGTTLLFSSKRIEEKSIPSTISMSDIVRHNSKRFDRVFTDIQHSVR